MPSPTPSGFLSLTIERLRASIAGSATFRTIVGAADETAAKAHIFYGKTDEKNSNHDRPRALIFRTPDLQINEAGFPAWMQEGALVVCFEFLTPTEYLGNDADARLDFTNTIGAILSELLARAKTAGYLSITGLQEYEFGEADLENDPDSAPYWVATFIVKYEGLAKL